MKKYVNIVIICFCMILLYMFTTTENTQAGEWFDMVGGEEEENNLHEQELVNPYNLYLNDIITYIKSSNNEDIQLRAEVCCADTVKTIKTTFYLQKKYSSGWTTVSEGIATKSDSHYMYKNMYVYDVTPGLYRCKVTAKVTDYSGYSETLTGYSPNLTID